MCWAGSCPSEATMEHCGHRSPPNRRNGCGWYGGVRTPVVTLTSVNAIGTAWPKVKHAQRGLFRGLRTGGVDGDVNHRNRSRYLQFSCGCVARWPAAAHSKCGRCEPGGQSIPEQLNAATRGPRGVRREVPPGGAAPLAFTGRASSRLQPVPAIFRSTSSTCNVVLSTESGLRLIESMPMRTRNSAISG